MSGGHLYVVVSEDPHGAAMLRVCPTWGAASLFARLSGDALALDYRIYEFPNDGLVGPGLLVEVGRSSAPPGPVVPSAAPGAWDESDEPGVWSADDRLLFWKIVAGTFGASCAAHLVLAGLASVGLL
jgi:hypothetical protein